MPLRLILGLLAGAAVAAIGGCTVGRDFAAPTMSNLTMGKTTEAELVQSLGEPRRRRVITLSRGGQAAQPDADPAPAESPQPKSASVTELAYEYENRAGTRLAGIMAWPPPWKTADFVFWNDRLVGYGFRSTFERDALAIDASRLDRLEKGKSTRDDVLVLLGEPTGRRVFPLVGQPEHELFVYTSIQDGGTRRTKEAEVLIGPDGRVRDYRFVEDTRPGPSYQPNGGTIPVFIPRGR